MPPGPDREGGECRAQQGSGAEQPDLPGTETQRQQIGGQQYRDIAVDESPQGLAGEQQSRFGRNAGREKHYCRPTRRAIFLAGVSAHQAYSASYSTMPCFSIS